MMKALSYAMLLCCRLLLSGMGGLSSPARPHTAGAITDTVPLPVTLVPSLSTAPLTLRLQPDTAFRHFPTIRLEWQLFLNGLPAKKGITAPFQPPSARPANIHLPVRLPPGPEEAFLRVTARLPSPRLPSSRLPASRLPASRLHPYPVFTRLLPLRPWRADNAITPTGELSFTDTLGIFTITSANTRIVFDKQTGWLLYYAAGHTLLMGDSAGLQPFLWRPPVQPRLQLFSSSTGARLIIVRAEYTVPEAGCLLHLSYTIDAAGEMLVGQSMEPDSTHEPPPPSSSQLPPLNRFGMRWTLPQGFDSVSWYGIASPADTGSPPTINHLPVTAARGSVFPNVRWLTITGALNQTMQIVADSSLLQIAIAPVNDSAAQRSILEIDASTPSPAHPLPAGAISFSFKVIPLPPAKPF